MIWPIIAGVTVVPIIFVVLWLNLRYSSSEDLVEKLVRRFVLQNDFAGLVSLIDLAETDLVKKSRKQQEILRQAIDDIAVKVLKSIDDFGILAFIYQNSVSQEAHRAAVDAQKKIVEILPGYINGVEETAEGYQLLSGLLDSNKYGCLEGDERLAVGDRMTVVLIAILGKIDDLPTLTGLMSNAGSQRDRDAIYRRQVALASIPPKIEMEILEDLAFGAASDEPLGTPIPDRSCK